MIASVLEFLEVPHVATLSRTCTTFRAARDRALARGNPRAVVGSSANEATLRKVLELCKNVTRFRSPENTPTWFAVWKPGAIYGPFPNEIPLDSIHCLQHTPSLRTFHGMLEPHEELHTIPEWARVLPNLRETFPNLEEVDFYSRAELTKKHLQYIAKWSTGKLRRKSLQRSWRWPFLRGRIHDILHRECTAADVKSSGVDRITIVVMVEPYRDWQHRDDERLRSILRGGLERAAEVLQDEALTCALTVSLHPLSLYDPEPDPLEVSSRFEVLKSTAIAIKHTFPNATMKADEKQHTIDFVIREGVQNDSQIGAKNITPYIFT